MSYQLMLRVATRTASRSYTFPTTTSWRCSKKLVARYWSQAFIWQFDLIK